MSALQEEMGAKMNVFLEDLKTSALRANEYICSVLNFGG